MRPVTPKRPCVVCGRSFTPKHHSIMFCSLKCRDDARRTRERKRMKRNRGRPEFRDAENARRRKNYRPECRP